jgi:hypothetical protein
MAYLAVVACSAVNGVAAIHSEIVKDEIFNDFYQVGVRDSKPMVHRHLPQTAVQLVCYERCMSSDWCSCDVLLHAVHAALLPRIPSCALGVQQPACSC